MNYLDPSGLFAISVPDFEQIAWSNVYGVFYVLTMLVPDLTGYDPPSADGGGGVDGASGIGSGFVGVSAPPINWPWPEVIIRINAWEWLRVLARNPAAILLAMSMARTSGGNLPPDPDKCPKGERFYDPTRAPHSDWAWYGGGGDVAPGQTGGYWYNTRSPGQRLRPDLNHSYPKGPHWEYTDPFGKRWECDRNGNIFEEGVEWW